MPLIQALLEAGGAHLEAGGVHLEAGGAHLEAEATQRGPPYLPSTRRQAFKVQGRGTFPRQ